LFSAPIIIVVVVVIQIRVACDVRVYLRRVLKKKKKKKRVQRFERAGNYEIFSPNFSFLILIFSFSAARFGATGKPAFGVEWSKREWCAKLHFCSLSLSTFSQKGNDDVVINDNNANEQRRRNKKKKRKNNGKDYLLLVSEVSLFRIVVVVVLERTTTTTTTKIQTRRQ